MKSLFLTSLLTICAALTAEAQQAGVYQLLTGGPTTIPASTTNEWTYTSAFGTSTNFIGLPGTASNLVQECDEYNDVGFTWSFSGTNTTTGGIVNLKVWKCFDTVSGTYNSVPDWTFSVTPTGTGTYLTNCDLNVPGVDRLAFTVENGTSGPLNNALLEINLKQQKRGGVEKAQ